ncbi:MAG TPA: glycosyltransferase [Gemmatimonadales bacterium]|nr:glycosyltransferase [Gemmatimonadales bacterium]
MSAIPVSVCIPVLNGAATLPALLEGVRRASAVGPIELIAVDSGSSDGSTELLRAAGATVLDLGGRPFSHAYARNRAAEHAAGEVLVFLTQDVEPAGEQWLAPLIGACREEGVAGAFGRQLPRGASPEEAFLARTNYPDTARRVTSADLDGPFAPGATYFSNAFGAMPRAVWARFQFPDILHSEDQAWALSVLRAGLEIRYEPRAAVYHGHRFGPVRLFRRNFDSGSALQQLGLAGSKWRAGLGYLGRELRWIAAEHGRAAAVRACAYELVRMTAFQLGRMERAMPAALARRLGEAPRG